MSDTPRTDDEEIAVSDEHELVRLNHAWKFARTLERETVVLRAEVERLRSAVRWACGYDEGAPRFEQPYNGPRYWWRGELMRRAGLSATEAK